jgi:hypothetical protein
MIYDIFQVLLWVTAILLAISGIDDLYMDMLFWLMRRKYKSRFPDFTNMMEKTEKPIAIILGAWSESSVIGRTLSYAVRNLKYDNFRIFVGVYPNDKETIRIVKEISLKDARVIACINPQNGPTTKADNLNSLYAGLCEYEKIYGEFEIIIVHDAEDFIHPNSLKLYNFLIGYKGYHAIQIPVIPIKSKLGGLLHRTYCDAFAEVHTKDMIVRQGMGTFIPFSGTGMGFHRKTMYFLEKNMDDSILNTNGEVLNPESDEHFFDDRGKKMAMNNNYFRNDEDDANEPFYYNDTEYHDDPFDSMSDKKTIYTRTVPESIKNFTIIFFALVLSGIGFLVYEGKTESENTEYMTKSDKGVFINKVFASDKQTSGYFNEQSLSENIEALNGGYRDVKYNVIYLPIEGGKLGIQESIWGSDVAANDRLASIISQPSLSDLTGYVSKTTKKNEIIYKVIISGYKNIDDARESIIKIRKIFKN